MTPPAPAAIAGAIDCVNRRRSGHREKWTRRTKTHTSGKHGALRWGRWTVKEACANVRRHGAGLAWGTGLEG